MHAVGRLEKRLDVAFVTAGGDGQERPCFIGDPRFPSNKRDAVVGADLVGRGLWEWIRPVNIPEDDCQLFSGLRFERVNILHPIDKGAGSAANRS